MPMDKMDQQAPFQPQAQAQAPTQASTQACLFSSVPPAPSVTALVPADPSAESDALFIIKAEASIYVAYISVS